jgi:hypothetical protein
MIVVQHRAQGATKFAVADRIATGKSFCHGLQEPATIERVQLFSVSHQRAKLLVRKCEWF